MEPVLVVLVILLALGFAYTNGFHDAANAIATSVATRALTPRAALLMAAVMNMVGAFLGTGVAKTVGSGIISPEGVSGLVVVLAGLVGAIVWNLITWWKGMPSSSSHAMIGGLTGAGVAAGLEVNWSVITDKVLLPMVVSPVLGFGLSFVAMVAVLWLFRKARPGPAQRRFRIAQTLSAAAMALGHGLQDAQKTMGVIFLAMFAGGYILSQDDDIPTWVILISALAISAGTYAGGWRIMRTLGRKVIEVDPAHGFVAETVAAGVLYYAAIVGNAPVSTTQTITASIMGVGATKRLSAVRWGVAGDIARAWVLTIPMSALMAAITYFIVQFFF